MTTFSFLKLYLLTAPVFFAIDLFWLGVVAKNVYFEKLGHLLAPKISWGPALLFYLFFIAGLIIFVVQPAIEKQSFQRAILLGAFFGFITYMTYELTNYSLLKDWPLSIVVIDIIWGMVLSALVSAASFAISKWVL